MKSHTVQRAYLKEFLLDSAHDRQFEVFSKVRKVWRRKSPRSTTAIEDYYAWAESDGTLNNSIEEELNRIETPGILALRKLARDEALNSVDRENVSLYLGCLLTRTTKTQEFQRLADNQLLNPDYVESYVESERNSLESRFPSSDVDQYIQRIRSGDATLQLPRAWYLHSLARSGKYAVLIHAMKWVVEKTKSPHWFITSDNPVFVCRPDKPHLPHVVGLTRDDLGAELCFPLNSTRYLRAGFGDVRAMGKRSSPARVRELNRRVVIHATDEVISPERSGAIESLVIEECDWFVTPFNPVYALT